MKHKPKKRTTKPNFKVYEALNRQAAALMKEKNNGDTKLEEVKDLNFKFKRI